MSSLQLFSNWSTAKKMLKSIKAVFFNWTAAKKTFESQTSVFCPNFLSVTCRVHRCLSHDPTVGSTWELAVNLITGEIVMALDPQLMNLSPQLPAPRGNKINQVNNVLRSDHYYFKIQSIPVNIYSNICISWLHRWGFTLLLLVKWSN